jgi:hypothetical protein
LWALPRIFLPILIGFLSFYIFVGTAVLNVQNIAWLNSGDASTHYLGWGFFRNSSWSMPIGLNPNFGLELSSSIVYSDSIPLLAIIFKFLSHYLSEPFQYFGIWLLLCFIGQSLSSYLLIGLFTENTILRCLSVGFFVCSPPMLIRMTDVSFNTFHLALVGHFLIIFGLYLFFDTRKRFFFYWLILLLVALAVHFYLFAIIYIFWIFKVIGNFYFTGSTTKKTFIFQFAILGFSISGFAWLLGYFAVGTSFVAGGYGSYNMNLASLLSPSGWSHFLPELYSLEGGEYEGFNFLGFGIIILLMISVTIYRKPSEWTRSVITKSPHLLCMILFFLAFSISNNIAIGHWSFNIQIPDLIIRLANLLRASGRLFWPVYYLIYLGVLVAVIRRFNTKQAYVVLSIALAVQMVDTSKGWVSVRQQLTVEPANKWYPSLTDPFWVEAANRYEVIRLLPPQIAATNWSQLASFAQENQIATDIVYLARVNQIKFDALKEKAIEILTEGDLSDNTLYVIDVTKIPQDFFDKYIKGDNLRIIDGIAVMTPFKSP